ncbi:amidase [Chenggangzhangella methanolivorans]|uniref:Amidase n=1 Tax=Chenggangzhangella methanolivorans TaxID=1437009 RepID=A0A9E6UN26_9HYPH|nr:amidase [Chenggangzhangella methanolivorans]QZO00601.1 amidase [Chenggangzhangella methanolivorans]
MFVDEIGALVPHGAVEREPTADGPLSGLTFALKDLFHLAGVPTSAGNPDWLNTHDVPSETAPVPAALLAAGARLAGKTITDEIAWSLNGENFHYGTPKNRAAPGRIPGGSSSGSAAAVAAGLVDFAIGTDTGGSVRLPASYCGLIGLRPTHGRIPIDGAVALAPSYDTVGWFARDLATFERVGGVLLGAPEKTVEPARLLVADDMWARARPETREALAPALEKLTGLFGGADHVEVSGARGAGWRDVFRIIQSAEAWSLHGDWVERVRPTFGPGVKERFEAASRLSADEIAGAKAGLETIRAEMEALLPPGVILVSPTVPGIAPLIGTPEPELNVFRAAALEMLCPAGHAGLPQISLPLGVVDGCPVGLSLVAARGQDEALIALAGRLLG